MSDPSDTRTAPMDGHEKPCCYCGKLCNGVAGRQQALKEKSPVRPPPNTPSTKGAMPPDIRREYGRLVRQSAEIELRWRAEVWDRAVCLAAGIVVGAVLTTVIQAQ